MALPGLRQQPMNKALARLSMLTLLFLSVACARADQLVWQSGFERGYPGGEWLDLGKGAYSFNGVMPEGMVAAWTIVDRLSGEPVLSGSHAYKGWIEGAAKASHRAYPGIHVDFPTPLVNTFHVYLDVDYGKMSPTDWIHFATWGNHDPELKTGLWALHTLSVRGGKLGFAHTSPFHGEYIGPAEPVEFPLRRWVRLTAYILYQGTTGSVQVWQDGTPMLRAEVSKLAIHPGTRLRTAHWGMYASGTVSQGVQYNDDIRICTLREPLTDLASEPGCP
jgi:hypothetical protein